MRATSRNNFTQLRPTGFDYDDGRFFGTIKNTVLPECFRRQVMLERPSSYHQQTMNYVQSYLMTNDNRRLRNNAIFVSR